jgi:exodeoxyribonuclease V beta subunit
MLLRMLNDVLHTALPVNTGQALRLADVTPGRRLNELEFHLPSHALDAERLNATLAALGYQVPRLAFRTLRGYLKGFIDLVLEHDGRYFVLDWKSNHLGDAADYAAPRRGGDGHARLPPASAALLRCAGSHAALPAAGLRPARHFGGAIYLFVRGVRPDWIDADGAPAGVHFARPTPEALARASALFDELPAR